jgi:hypothetical protein
VWLNKGLIVTGGDPDHVIAEYLKTVGAREADVEGAGAGRLWGDGRMRIVRGWVENAGGAQVGRVRSGDTPTIVVVAEAIEAVDQPVLGLEVRAEDGTQVYTMSSKDSGVRSVLVPAGHAIEWRIQCVAALRNGRYMVSAGIADRHTTTYHDLVDGVFEFVVHGSLCRQIGADSHGRISHADLQGCISYRLAPAADIEAEDAPRPLEKGGVR